MNTLNNAQMLILLVIVNVLIFFCCEYIHVLPQNVSSKEFWDLEKKQFFQTRFNLPNLSVLIYFYKKRTESKVRPIYQILYMRSVPVQANTTYFLIVKCCFQHSSLTQHYYDLVSKKLCLRNHILLLMFFFKDIYSFAKRYYELVS